MAGGDHGWLQDRPMLPAPAADSSALLQPIYGPRRVSDPHTDVRGLIASSAERPLDVLDVVVHYGSFVTAQFVVCFFVVRFKDMGRTAMIDVRQLFTLFQV